MDEAELNETEPVCHRKRAVVSGIPQLPQSRFQGRQHLVVLPITQVFTVFESVSGHGAVVARLAPLGRRCLVRRANGKTMGLGGSREPRDPLLVQKMDGTRSDFFQRAAQASGGTRSANEQ